MQELKKIGKLTFHRRVWKSGDFYVISIPKDLANTYAFEGAFLEVTIKQVGKWK